MTGLTAPRRLVVLAVSATATCMAVCVLVPVHALSAVAAVPLALLLPGTALIAAIDPWSARLRKSERLYWSLGSSIVLTILGGLVLNEVGSLTRLSWCLFVAVVVVTSSVICWDRSSLPGEHYIAPPERHGVGLRSLILLTSTAALLAGSLVLSQVSYSRATRENFTELWVLPVPIIDGDSAKHFKVGISNHENARATFIVTLTTGGRALRSWRLRLEKGQSWQKLLSRPREETIYATVSMASDPTRALSSVHLSAPAPYHRSAS